MGNLGREQISTPREQVLKDRFSIFPKSLSVMAPTGLNLPSTISKGKSSETGRGVTSGQMQHYHTNFKTSQVNTDTSHKFILDFKLP